MFISVWLTISSHDSEVSTLTGFSHIAIKLSPREHKWICSSCTELIKSARCGAGRREGAVQCRPLNGNHNSKPVRDSIVSCHHSPLCLSCASYRNPSPSSVSVPSAPRVIHHLFRLTILVWRRQSRHTRPAAWVCRKPTFSFFLSGILENLAQPMFSSMVFVPDTPKAPSSCTSNCHTKLSHQSHLL